MFVYTSHKNLILSRSLFIEACLVLCARLSVEVMCEVVLSKSYLLRVIHFAEIRSSDVFVWECDD